MESLDVFVSGPWRDTMDEVIKDKKWLQDKFMPKDYHGGWSLGDEVFEGQYRATFGFTSR